MVAEIDFTDPGRRVEEEWEPAFTYESCSSWEKGLFSYLSMPRTGPSRWLVSDPVGA